MNDSLEIVFLIIGLALAIGATAFAVRALWRGEGVWKTFLKWLLNVFDSFG